MGCILMMMFTHHVIGALGVVNLQVVSPLSGISVNGQVNVFTSFHKAVQAANAIPQGDVFLYILPALQFTQRPPFFQQGECIMLPACPSNFSQIQSASGCIFYTSTTFPITTPLSVQRSITIRNNCDTPTSSIPVTLVPTLLGTVPASTCTIFNVSAGPFRIEGETNSIVINDTECNVQTNTHLFRSTFIFSGSGTSALLQRMTMNGVQQVVTIQRMPATLEGNQPNNVNVTLDTVTVVQSTPSFFGAAINTTGRMSITNLQGMTNPQFAVYQPLGGTFQFFVDDILVEQTNNPLVLNVISNALAGPFTVFDVTEIFTSCNCPMEIVTIVVICVVICVLIVVIGYVFIKRRGDQYAAQKLVGTKLKDVQAHKNEMVSRFITNQRIQ